MSIHKIIFWETTTIKLNQTKNRKKKKHLKSCWHKMRAVLQKLPYQDISQATQACQFSLEVKTAPKKELFMLSILQTKPQVKSECKFINKRIHQCFSLKHTLCITNPSPSTLHTYIYTFQAHHNTTLSALPPKTNCCFLTLV